tara:strand:+ start:3780 stop:5180 length:1401 start_codon:yes stop_codon:yes gene_type:complete
MKKIDKDKKNHLKVIHILSRLVWVFLIGSLIAFFYTVYQSEYLNQGLNRNIYNKYYLFFFSSTLFWICAFFFSKEIRSNLVLIFSSLFLSLYILEGMLIYYGHGQPVLETTIKTASNLGIDFDTRTKIELISDYKSKGKTLVPSIGPSILVSQDNNYLNQNNSLFSLGGISNTITVMGNESGEYAIYKSDRFGFNNPDSAWDSQSIDWLLIGDSFVQGAMVNSGEDLGSRIRDLTQENLISLGNSGNSTLTEFALLREYGKFLKPKKTFLVYFEGNDLMGLSKEREVHILKRYFEDDDFSQNLIKRQEEIDLILQRIISKNLAISKRKSSKLLNSTGWLRLRSLRNVINLDVKKRIPLEPDPLFFEILEKSNSLVQSWGGKLYFVYLPDYHRYSKSDIDHDLFLKKNYLLNEVKNLGISYIDIHSEVFNQRKDPLSYFPLKLYGHYTEEGYLEVAKSLVNLVNNIE